MATFVYGKRIDNIGGATDAQLYRIAVEVAQVSSEVDTIEAELRRIRNEAQRDRAEVRTRANLTGTATGATVGKISPKGRAKLTLDQGGASVGNNRARFSIGSRGMLAGGQAFLIFGIANTVGSAARTWNEQQETRERYGAGEVLGRAGRGVLRNVFSPSEQLSDTIAEVGKSFGADESWARNYKKRVEDALNYLFETQVEEIERKTREHFARIEADRKQNEFVNEQVMFINKYQPPNIQVRTSAEAAAVRQHLWRNNEEEVKNGVENARKINFAGID